jgi:hypothetical protein
LLLTESFTSILSGKDIVSSSGAVHFSLGRDIEDLAFDRNVYGLGGVLAIMGRQFGDRNGIVLLVNMFRPIDAYLWRS